MARQLPITYNVPPEIKPAIREALGYLILLCPGWVNNIYIDFHAHAPEEQAGFTLAEMRADYAYRRVYLTIYPRWLWENERSRKETLVHEAVHVLNAPVQNYVEAAIKAMFKDNKASEDLFVAGWRIANEASTEDIARALMSTAQWGEVELADVEDADKEEAEPPATRENEYVLPAKPKDEPEVVKKDAE
jgi:hypothetical protein